MSAWALMAIVSLSGAQAVAPSPPSYDEALRCAGLTQAASELEGGESGEGRSLYDAALYWSLTAAQIAQTSARSSGSAESDQTRARIRAVGELTARVAGAQADLERCRVRTPELG